MRTPRALLAFVSIAAVAAAACSDRGDSAGGVYVLRAMGDSQPPFVQYRSATWTDWLVADTLVLDGGGHATIGTTTRAETNGTITQSTFPQRGTYSVRRDTLEIKILCAMADRVPHDAPRAATAPRSAIYVGPIYCGYLYLMRGGGLASISVADVQPTVPRYYERVVRIPRVP